MSKAFGYSLWLVPKRGSKVHRLLTQCIGGISALYQTPNFVPHVTLLGWTNDNKGDIHSKTQKIAKELAPYEMQIGRVGSNGTHFQVLFLEIKQTDSVVRANTVAQTVFGMSGGKYFPHMSIAYGDLSQNEIVDLQIRVARSPLVGKKFKVQSIELWRTEGEVQDWYRVMTFPLCKQDKGR